MRTQPPPYPRPVPEIDFHEIETFPDTLIYGSATDDDMDQETRAIKRRRIEDAATAYLRGQELYISSARLKGPLNSTWRNPWSRQSIRQIHSRSGVREHKSSRVSALGSLRRREVDLEHPMLKTPVTEREAAAKRNSDDRVQTWLRRNDMADKNSVDQTSQPIPSPTPARKVQVNINSADSNAPSKYITPIHPISPTTSLPAVKKGDGYVRPRKSAFVSHAKLQHVLRKEVDQNKATQEHISSDLDEPHSQARAESAIRQMKQEKQESRVSEQADQDDDSAAVIDEPVPMAADECDNAFSQMTPENSQDGRSQIQDVESQPHNDDSKVASIPKLFSPEPIADEVNSRHGPKPGNQDEPTETKSRRRSSRGITKQKLSTQGQMLPPATVPSEPSTAELLPSAQKQPGVSVTSSHMLEEDKPIELVTSRAEEDLATVPYTGLDVPTTEAALAKVDNQDEQTPKPSFGAEPFKMSNSVTPRPKPARKKKQASFAVDGERWPSNGSIRSALKVGKSMTSIAESQKRKMLDIQEPDENALSQGSPPRKRSMLASFREDTDVSKPPRSILKNSNTSSTSHPSHQRGPSSIFMQNERDQKQADQDGQNGGADDIEHFDLDGAIDDLGSFLSTWEAEKEASQLITG